MSGKRYTEEFKREAVKQVTEQGYAVIDVAKRLGVSKFSLYDWVALYSDRGKKPAPLGDPGAQIRRLEAELKRVTEERDILKKAAAYFAKQSR
jgi:transposase